LKKGDKTLSILFCKPSAPPNFAQIIFIEFSSKMPKELKASIDSLTVVNKKLMESQQHMDSAITAYESQVNQIDNHISHIKSQTTIVNKYYNDLGQQVDQYVPNQVDSFFHQRYNY
jgi:DNA-binding transcriptional regulator GbsR (MarR family)